jgi:crossover junction endodeoxyribonuclease RuvC
MSLAGDANAQRVVLGIDPGLRITGYGVVDVSANSISYVSHGAIRTAPGDHGSRLLQIHEQVKDLVRRWRVQEAAIEKQFVALNASSAFAIGEARAAAILACASAGVPAFEYTPAEIKESVTSYGRSGKAQIQEMVRMQFGWAEPPQPADAADALAIAICHAARRALPVSGARAPAGLGSRSRRARPQR